MEKKIRDIKLVESGHSHMILDVEYEYPDGVVEVFCCGTKSEKVASLGFRTKLIKATEPIENGNGDDYDYSEYRVGTDPINAQTPSRSGVVWKSIDTPSRKVYKIDKHKKRNKMRKRELQELVKKNERIIEMLKQVIGYKDEVINSRDDRIQKLYKEKGRIRLDNIALRHKADSFERLYEDSLSVYPYVSDLYEIVVNNEEGIRKQYLKAFEEVDGDIEEFIKRNKR